MDYSLITRKQLVLGLLALIALFAAQFFLTHSVLIIQSDSTSEKVINLRHGDEARDFTITSDSKMFILRKGDYAIEAASKDKLSVYHRKLGAFWVHKVIVEPSPQKSAVPLGESRLNCAFDAGSSQRVMYFPCSPSTTNTIQSTSDGVNTIDAYSSTPIGAVSGYEGSQDESLSQGYSLQQYGGGFLSAESKDGHLLIEGRGLKQDVGIHVSDFEGKISDNTFSVSSSASEGVFSVLDDKKKELLVFEDGGDKSPTKIDLSGEIISNGLLEYKVLASNKYMFVLNTNSLESLEGDPDQPNAAIPEKKDQKIIVVDASSGEIVASHSLPKDIFIRDVSVSPGGNLLYVPLYAEDGEIYIETGANNPKKLHSLQNTIGPICWKNDNSFYYSADSNSAIYLYSLGEGVSSLVYSNPEATIYGFRCGASGKLYFNLTSPDDTDPDLVTQHFTEKTNIIPVNR